MHPDVPTLLVATLLASLTMSLVMSVVGWGMPREGLQLWALGLFVHGLGYLLFLLRGQTGDLVSILLGNALTALSIGCLLAAVRRFYGLGFSWAALIGPPLALSALLFWKLDDFFARLLITGVVFSLQAAAVAGTLWLRRRETVGRGASMVMVGMGIEALALALRASGGLAPDTRLVTLLDPAPLQTLTFMTTFAVLLITSLGFIFMTKERADEANRVLAAADMLTGVANRRAIVAALDRDVGRAIRTREPLALMMIDLDHFKSINDTYGHLCGDAVLRELATLVRERIRTQDIVGRYGGEEFLVVLPDTSLAGVQQLATQLCEAVARHRVAHGKDTVALTVSIGVCGGRLEPGDSWDLLIHAADQALYAAKNAGRNRVETAGALEPIRRQHAGAFGSETFPPSRN